MKTLIFLAFAPALAFSQVPVTFESGTPARAAEVNQNFSALDTRITDNVEAVNTAIDDNVSDLSGRIDQSIGGIIISGVASSDGSGVAVAECPADRIAISANCSCDNEGGARNFGVLFACQVAGNGGVVGCFNQGATFDPSLPSPMATLVLGCVSAVRNDGSKIDPGPIVLKPGTEQASSNIQSLNATDDLEAAIKSVRDQVADHKVRLQQ